MFNVARIAILQSIIGSDVDSYQLR